MSLLATGTIGIDTVETATDAAHEVLGGSAAYFCFAARLFTPVRLVGVVGDDFPDHFRDLFKGHPIDLAGLETRKGAKTFRWHGRYHRDMNVRDTLQTDLNVVAEEPPKVPDAFRDSKYIFLANTHPAVQRGFLDQLDKPRLVVMDTMDLWINAHRPELVETLKAVTGIVLNDAEARMLTEEDDLLAAGRGVLKLGPHFVVIKKGEHGAILMDADETFVLPAFPTVRVKDPTGAGDSFAAGMMGYLASVDRTDMPALKAAVARGTCAASITIEDFSVHAIRNADPDTVARRLEMLRNMLAFD